MDALSDLLPDVFAEVKHTGSVFDRLDPPPGVRCECGELHDWDWWTPNKPSHQRFRARWMHPKVSPCYRCTKKVDTAAHFELEARQKASGVPWRYRTFRIDRKRMQGTDVPVDTFRDNVRRHNGANLGRPIIGVGFTGIKAYRAVADWEPAHGSLLLHGPPGTGKTLLLCALATKLLEVPPSQDVDMLAAGRIDQPQSEAARKYMLSRGLHMCTVRQPMASSVLYITTEELAEREALRWKGDAQPMYQAASASVLLLDELWGETKPTTAQVNGVKRVVNYRYKHRLPTLMATNAKPEELLDERAGPYGARIADRMAEQLQGSVYAMGGTSWRR